MTGNLSSHHKKRFVTAAALFDGHDAAINIIRRLLVTHGAEVIHLGHNRSVIEIVDAAIQEDAQGIAVSSYQGGHIEFFSYMIDLLRSRKAGHIRIFAGGGGVIIPEEIKQLENYGVTKIFSPDDGRQLGLDGMIDLMIRMCDDDRTARIPTSEISTGKTQHTSLDKKTLHYSIDFAEVAHRITLAEQGESDDIDSALTRGISPFPNPVIGITGPGGAGKSSLTDELIRRFVIDFPQHTIAVLAVDPTKRRTGGALLGDRIRFNALDPTRVFMRSLATRQAHSTLAVAIEQALAITKSAGFDLIIIESAGAGQADSEIADIADISIYVMTPEYGAALQLEKIDMLDYADLIAINKFDRPGALDALRDVRKQYRRSHKEFSSPDESLPVIATCAHQFNDRGVNTLFLATLELLGESFGAPWTQVESCAKPTGTPERHPVIPAERIGYLREIAGVCRDARTQAQTQARVARQLYQLVGARAILCARQGSGDHDDLWHLFEEIVDGKAESGPGITDLDAEIRRLARTLHHDSRELLATWSQLKCDYGGDELTYAVRGKPVTVALSSVTLAGTHIPKVALPLADDWGDILLFLARENVPGAHPYTAGVFPLKRTEELPTRMFAGEGGPERTNRRFHYLSQGQPAVRLSTAFDSVTLYGEDPDARPDIFGKIGESGVSICTVEDMERLYAGFDLCANNTSVSMTINGPAPMILAMFFNVAGRQEAKRRLITSGRLPGAPEDALQPTVNGKNWDEITLLLPHREWQDALSCAVALVRGTVQADILKEDQAQNTCIFGTNFALRMMADIQSWFSANSVRNFYSVSISGYHIAEAGANPISQLAFTLANGFTYVETYLARGMQIDDFAPNLSFFFSNGMDAEYSVIGRVARRIWAVAIRERYRGSERSAKLKYHIQTSGRSLHALEISFNDVRTTLQALLALADNCNSLHTNAYDEAITTPTEESVRRALAIQLINTAEFGILKNENPWQGSYFLEWLTNHMEEAVLDEFERLDERGGVLGAMETGYQRSRIQEESLHYERLKHSGEFPIIGVNTFLDSSRTTNALETGALTRASQEEKNARLAHLQEFQAKHAGEEGRGPRAEGSGKEPSLDEFLDASISIDANKSEEALWQRTSQEALARLQHVARNGENLFAELINTVCSCSLGQITRALYDVGGKYRRSM